jgi:hypothetical protein
MRVAMCSSIAQLTIYFAVIGRIQIYKVATANIFYLIMWTLNYAIVTHFYQISSDVRINDDYSINLVYLYGGFVGLVVILDTPSRLVVRTRAKRYHAYYPKILAALGMIFMTISFVFTHATVGKMDTTGTSAFNQNNDQRTVFVPEGSIGIFFAISSSVLTGSALSIIMNQNSKMHLSDLLGSTIGGAIMFGSTANFASNLAIPIVLGMAAGAVCILYKVKLMPYLNKKKLKDALGFLGPFFICPVLGNFVATPLIVASY